MPTITPNLGRAIDELRGRLGANTMSMRATAPRDLARIERLVSDRRRIMMLLDRHENRLDRLRVSQRIDAMING